VLESARELFARDGYDGTTTSEICAHAGVSERLLFSNFGSKAELFQTVIVDPFSTLIGEYTASWARDAPGWTPEARIRLFVEGLMGLARENRAILLSALAPRRGRPDPEVQLLDTLAQLFQGMEGLAEVERELMDYRIDPPVTIAAAAAMVLGIVLMEELLFPAGTPRPGPQRIAVELTDMILHGVAGRPTRDP
jgi:AcrR family transcriptional regulator